MWDKVTIMHTSYQTLNRFLQQALAPTHPSSSSQSAAVEMVPGDVVPTLTRQKTDAASLAATDRVLRQVAEFDRGYFGGDAEGAGSGIGQGGTYLPSTFYMTAYRRIGADLMR